MPRPGSVLTTVPVRTINGPIDLASKWSRGALIVGYHHLHCNVCQLADIELSCLAPEVHGLGGDIVIVYADHVDEVARTCAERRTQALCASDSYGVLHGLATDSYGVYGLAGDGHAPHREPATFVVDRSGRVVYAQPTHSTDRPTRMSDVADAMRAALGAR